MAVTQIKICNLALIRVGADPIQSISQDTRSATLLNAIWEQKRDSVMSAHPWNFAIKRTTLAPNSSEPEHGYEYAYDKPSDYLGWLMVEPDDIDHVVEDEEILTDETELDVTYVYRNENENSWSATFGDALAWELAAEISFPLTGNLALRKSCEDNRDKVISYARSLDGNEGIMRRLVADVWTNVRR